MTFTDILQHFKQNESPERIIPLIDDSKLRMSLVAWESVKVEKRANVDCTLTEENDQWHWMWEQVSFDQNTYSVVAGVQVHEIVNILVRLKGLKLIYPDGTICNLAKQYLQTIIVSQLPKRKKN
jgi:hypothetical protein